MLSYCTSSPNSTTTTGPDLMPKLYLHLTQLELQALREHLRKDCTSTLLASVLEKADAMDDRLVRTAKLMRKFPVREA